MRARWVGSLRSRRRWLLLCGVAASLLCGSTACEKKDKVVIENIGQAQENQPPKIIAFGPEAPAGGFAVTGRYGPELWALAGDPNGLGDIALVAMDVDSVRLVRYIVRPDTSTTSCLDYGYGPEDTLDTNAILPVPATFPGVKFRPLQPVQGGLFRADPLGRTLGFPDIIGASSVLDDWTTGCRSGFEVYGPFYVDPPAVPFRLGAGVSYMELEYCGIRITAYDKVGATASVVYPNVRITFKAPLEPTPFP